MKTLRLFSVQAGILLLTGAMLGLVLGGLLRSAGAGETGVAAPPPPPPSASRSAAARALAYTVTIEDRGIYGSGILVVPRAGLILTAAHVVSDMSRPQVSFGDGQHFPGRLLDLDRGLDLALLEIPPQERPAPQFGDALALDAGDEVYAVGCPRHLPFSVARGIVSYLGRIMDGARWLQTDIPVNEGNSGGPVVDRTGRLVAMTSFILRRAQGLSFALPIDYALERFSQLTPLGDREQLERFRHWRGPLPVEEGRAPVRK
jgi:S1-C subfamily serine protease